MLKDMPKSLDDDALESVVGGAGSNDGRVEANGTVVAALGNGRFEVNVGGQTIVASESGKLRMNYVSVKPGDSVKVDYTPGGSGKITYRYK